MNPFPVKNIKGLLLMCVIAILNSCEQKQTKAKEVINSKPNIVLIYADDQGTLDAGCYGINDIKAYAPKHLDALAKKGIRFTQSLCAYSLLPLQSNIYIINESISS